MTVKAEPARTHFVPVVEADVLDRMNETSELIAQRAYEIYQSRGGGHGFHEEDWFQAEQEILPKLEPDYEVTENEVRVTAQVPGFDASDLEVVVGHKRAVVCGVHRASGQRGADGRTIKKVMGIFELPFAINPAASRAMLRSGRLEVMLPRARQ
jgi:HSP20 family molecular chaperone IbpA